MRMRVRAGRGLPGRVKRTKPASRRAATGSGEEQKASTWLNALKGQCAARASCLQALTQKVAGSGPSPALSEN